MPVRAFERVSKLLLAILGPWVLLMAYASAQAAVFSLEVGLNGLTSDRLEVARDASFAAPLVSSRIGQSSHYLVNFEKSGVYTYRLLREGREIERDQVVVVLEAPPPGQLIEVSWDAAPGEPTYRLGFNQKDGAKSWVLTTVPLAYFKARALPWILKVRVLAGAVNQPVAGLRMIFTKPPPTAIVSSPTLKSEPVLQLDPFAPDDDQTSAEPEYRELLQGPENKWWNIGGLLNGGGRGRGALEALERRSSIALWIRTFKEDFAVNRRDRYASPPTQGLGTGFGFHYYVQPTFQVQLEGDTHATATDYDAGGTEPPGRVQKRMKFLLGALFDVANLQTRHAAYSIDIGTNIALIQVPLRVDDQRIPDIGLQASYRYIPWGVEAIVRSYKSASYETQMNLALPLRLKIGRAKAPLDLKPAAGLYLRQTKARDGDVSSDFHETGLRLGMQLEF